MQLDQLGSRHAVDHREFRLGKSDPAHQTYRNGTRLAAKIGDATKARPPCRLLGKGPPLDTVAQKAPYLK